MDPEERKSETLLRLLRGDISTLNHLLQAAYFARFSRAKAPDSLVNLRLGQDHAGTGLLYEASQINIRRAQSHVQDLEFALRDERNAV